MSGIWQLAVHLTVRSDGIFLVHKEQTLIIHVLAFSFEPCSSDKAPQLLKKRKKKNLELTSRLYMHRCHQGNLWFGV